MTHLIVVRPFGRRAPGDIISDPAEIEATLAGEHSAMVVRSTVPAEG